MASNAPSRRCTVLENSLAGAAAGLVGETLCHPFDTVNTRLKVMPGRVGFLAATQQIVGREGPRALFAGMGATLLASVPSSALYFATYEIFKHAGLMAFPGAPSPALHACAGAASELAGSVIIVPAEVVKCRLQLGRDPVGASGGWARFSAAVTGRAESCLPSKSSRVSLASAASGENYRSSFHAFRAIARAEGLRGLYAGYVPCLLTDCTFSALQFVLYEQLKPWAQRAQGRDPEAPPDHRTALGCGAVAGAAAAALSNPLDVVTTRMMVQGGSSAAARDGAGGLRAAGAIDCARRLVRDEGVRALGRGVVPRVLSITPMASVTFCVYEWAKFFFLRRPRPLGAWGDEAARGSPDGGIVGPVARTSVSAAGPGVLRRRGSTRWGEDTAGPAG
jgi:hypothetical protein